MTKSLSVFIMISHLNMLRGSLGPRTLTLCCQVPACGCLETPRVFTRALHCLKDLWVLLFTDDGCARKFVVSGDVFFFLGGKGNVLSP